MAVEGVPWAVGGGAQHTAEVARLATYASTSGAEGIVGVSDLKVSPLAVPGTAVRAALGAGLILNRATGGDQQTYAFRAPTETQVDVAATGSGAGRSDLVVAIIKDPNMPGTGYDTPSDVTTGPYAFIEVIAGVPAGTTSVQAVSGHANDSAIALARVDIPASTGTITAAMITDLRKVALPRTQRILSPLALVTGEEETLTSTATGGEYWPDAAGERWPSLEIPSWATRMRVVITWAGIKTSGNSWGTVWIQLGVNGGANTVTTQTVSFDTPNIEANNRFVIVAADDIAIPAALRGTTQLVRPRGRIAGGTGTARPMVDATSAIIRDVEFYEKAA